MIRVLISKARKTRVPFSYDAVQIVVDVGPIFAPGDRRDIAIGPHEPDAVFGKRRSELRLQQVTVANKQVGTG